MPMRFFADHCVSNFIVKTLRDAGYEVFLLKEHIPVDSPDPPIISKAQELDSILISLNGDFSDIVTYPPVNYKGIISPSGEKSSGNYTTAYHKVERLLVSPLRYVLL